MSASPLKPRFGPRLPVQAGGRTRGTVRISRRKLARLRWVCQSFRLWGDRHGAPRRMESQSRGAAKRSKSTAVLATLQQGARVHAVFQYLKQRQLPLLGYRSGNDSNLRRDAEEMVTAAAARQSFGAFAEFALAYNNHISLNELAELHRLATKNLPPPRPAARKGATAVPRGSSSDGGSSAPRLPPPS